MTRRVDVDGYPVDCCACGQPIVKAHGGSRHERNDLTGTVASWHHACDPQRPPKKENP